MLNFAHIYHMLTDCRDSNPDIILRKLFGQTPNEAQLERLQSYLTDYYPALNQRLFQAVSDNIASDTSLRSRALSHFRSLNTEMGYFDLPENNEQCQALPIFRHYVDFLRVVDFVFQVVEGNQQMDDMVASHAYKMLALFPPQAKGGALTAFTQFYKSTSAAPQNHWFAQSHQPLHQLFLAGMPEGLTQLPSLRELLKKKPDMGGFILQQLDQLQSVEKMLHADGKSFSDLTMAMFKTYLAKIQYQQFDKAPDLAALFVKLRISEKIFNRCVALIENGDLTLPKNEHGHFVTMVEDKLPNVTVMGRDLDDPNLAPYVWTKLPKGNPRGLVLGKLTSCCQFIGGNSHQCVMDGMNLSHNSFYVMLKLYDPSRFNLHDPNWWHDLESYAQIEGQSYLWESENGNLCLDSIETHSNARHVLRGEQWKMFMERFGATLTEQYQVDRLMIGIGGETPIELKNNIKHKLEYMREGTQYGDSVKQSIIYEAPAYLAERQKIDSELQQNEFRFSTERAFPTRRIIADFNAKNEEQKKFFIQEQFLYHYEKTKYLITSGSLSASAFFTHDISQFKLLINSNAIALYQSHSLNPQDLKHFTNNIIEHVLLSAIGTQAFRQSQQWSSETLSQQKTNEIVAYVFTRAGFPTTAEEIGCDLPEAVLQHIFSDKALTLYQNKMTTPAYLAGVNESKLHLLISYQAIELYGNKQLKPQDLGKFNAQSIQHIFCSPIGKQAFAKKQEWSSEALSQKTTSEIAAYVLTRAGFPTAAEEIGHDLSESVLKYIFSDKALTLYKDGITTPGYLAGIDENKLHLLTNDQAMALYENKQISPQDLNKFNTQHIEGIFLSPVGQKAFTKEESWSSDALSKKTPAEIATYVLTRAGFPIDAEKMEHYTSTHFFEVMFLQHALEAYEAGAAKPEDFLVSRFDAKKNKLLFSDYGDARKAFRSGHVKMSDISDLPLRKISKLINNGALAAYKTGTVTPQDIAHLSPDLITLMVNNTEILEAQNMKAAACRDLSPVKRRLLFSKLAYKVFVTQKENDFESLIEQEPRAILVHLLNKSGVACGIEDIATNISEDSLLKLATPDTVDMCHAGLSLQQLSSSQKEKHHLLSSYSMSEIWRENYIPLNILAHAETSVLKLLSSRVVIYEISDGLTEEININTTPHEVAAQLLNCLFKCQTSTTELEGQSEAMLFSLVNPPFTCLYEYEKSIAEICAVGEAKWRLLGFFEDSDKNPLADFCIKSFNTKTLTLDILQSCSEETLCLLQRSNIRNALQNTPLTLDDIAIIESSHLDLLTSPLAISTFPHEHYATLIAKAKTCSIAELAAFICQKKGMDTETAWFENTSQTQLALMFSEDAIKAFATEKLHMRDLTKANEQQLQRMISNNAQTLYRTGHVTGEMLRQFSPEKLSLLCQINDSVGYQIKEIGSLLVDKDESQLRLLRTRIAKELFSKHRSNLANWLSGLLTKSPNEMTRDLLLESGNDIQNISFSSISVQQCKLLLDTSSFFTQISDGIEQLLACDDVTSSLLCAHFTKQLLVRAPTISRGTMLKEMCQLSPAGLVSYVLNGFGYHCAEKDIAHFPPETLTLLLKDLGVGAFRDYGMRSEDFRHISSEKLPIVLGKLRSGILENYLEDPTQVIALLEQLPLAEVERWDKLPRNAPLPTLDEKPQPHAVTPVTAMENSHRQPQL